MAREFIEVVRCDIHGGVIEDDQELQELNITINGKEYKLELCSECYSPDGITLAQVEEFGHRVEARKRRKSRAASAATPTPDGAFACGFPGCDKTSPTLQGIGRHKHAAGHYTKAEQKARTQKKALVASV